MIGPVHLINNKYYRWYFDIINAARQRSKSSNTERHHIYAKSFGGTWSDNNIVNLTFREHFLCHLLLVKFTSGTAQRKMKIAINFMIRGSRTIIRTPTSWQFSLAKSLSRGKREGWVHPSKGRKFTEEEKIARGYGNRPKCTEETKKKISLAQKNKPIPKWNEGKKWSEEVKEKMRGKKRTDEHKKAISVKNSGKVFTEDHRKKLSDAKLGKKPSNVTEREICIFCNLESTRVLIKRYHNYNCRFRSDRIAIPLSNKFLCVEVE